MKYLDSFADIMKHTTSPWIALIIVLTAPLLSVIDIFIVNVAIPSIKIGVHASDGQIQLVIAGYLLGYASFLITGGRAGDDFGRKTVFFWGMLSFTVFSCLCGLSQTPLLLNVTRFFQGMSASFMVPQAIAFIQILFTDPKERAKAFGWFGITLGIASIIGQVLGGYLSEIHTFIDGWRFIFFINLPVGLVALWATHHFLPETGRHAKLAFDYSGIAILTLGLFCLIYPLTQGREAGWPLWSIVLLLLSMVSFVYFIYDQKEKLKKGVSPLINMELFNNKDFSIGLIAVLFQFMMHTSYLLTSAVFLQNGLGISSANAGLYFVLPGILFTLSSVTASKLLPRYGKLIPQSGILIIILSFALQIHFFKSSVSGGIIFILMGIYGMGNGLVLPSLLNLALKGVPQKFAGAAAGVYSTFQQTASALGICIIGGIFYSVADTGSNTWNYTKAFEYSTYANILCLVLTGLMLALLPKAKNDTHELHIAE
ncbi:MFS transporter [Pedobacter metabolipauper]|uniref:EmrB/QacA subfamily drug resistance transporter n=1 Tax=Pedobacter metabolipauper TaxID=425513 RepID=A0A4R6STJ2_9SPHI|nr:MFS transporter [Pedobacter metabolipauper]TDQ08243.1 EmrB/QacA subfamily drug resistance transporter [Pedobacter metabolipauper]